MLLEISGEITPEGMEPKQKQYPAVDVTGDRSKVPCCKEQYCIGTWNVRSMNQGKLEVVKQEMARVNVDNGWDGGEMGGRSKREGIYVYQQLIHFLVLQKLMQHCKAIVLQ